MIKNTLKSERKDMAQINLTSMTDILLTLLIFFMLIETAKTEFGLNLNLPSEKIKQTRSNVKNSTITITCAPNGKISVKTPDQKTASISAPELPDFLEGLRNRRTCDSLIIKGEKSVKYRDIITLTDIARRAGFDKISLVTNS